VMPSGMLQHPLFVGWLVTRPASGRRALRPPAPVVAEPEREATMFDRSRCRMRTASARACCLIP
jgi:hypothetical protein